ncbi:MAG: septation protein SepH [Marmoricola sp.]
MQDLTPVGLSKDGRRLLLVSPAGEEFAVAVDARLRSALRGENVRLGQLEMKMESALRPRDIQARIRAGESPEEVAAAAQTTVEAIMGFATPVLAERAHVAQTALKASVRRRSGESSSAGRTLGEAAGLFFGDHSLHDEDVEWDAWRRADGRWALVAAYSIDGRGRTAEFSHDLPGRYVIAENDEARILTGELHEPEARAASGAARQPQSRRLSSVPSQDELPLGDDAIELVRDREPAADEPTDVTAAEDTQPVGQPVDQPLPGADAADADWIAQPPIDDPITAEQRDAGPGADLGSHLGDEPHVEDGLEDAGPGAGILTDEPVAEPTPPKKKSRSSVPSWDEIMFGGGKSE